VKDKLKVINFPSSHRCHHCCCLGERKTILYVHNFFLYPSMPSHSCKTRRAFIFIPCHFLRLAHGGNSINCLTHDTKDDCYRCCCCRSFCRRKRWMVRVTNDVPDDPENYQLMWLRTENCFLCQSVCGL
jgi:hypothetical protein